ncbi:MAG: guanine deaminase [Woeseiaceae bacterium]|nr:guanine deaminase [Woeseiaceae bacterium]
MPQVRALRATIVHCLGSDELDVIEDGVLVVDGGRVAATGAAADILSTLGSTVSVDDFSGKLLLPGFIDCHVHYPQLDMMASWGEQLLDWLERYAYPEEQKFVDAEHAQRVAIRFADELLRNGTTSALVFATVHAHSAEAMFEAARGRGMRLVTGKTAMDRNCPRPLRDSPEAADRESRELIERWHGVDRLGYALTPRFALTSSDAQLRVLGRLAEEFPDVHVHTHLAENDDEIVAVRERFPEARSYLDVYAARGLLRERAVFAHCLHLDPADWQALADARGSVAFCPSSNLFLGSGVFDIDQADAAGVDVGIGSDVGGGTSLSLLKTLADGYKSLQLARRTVTPERLLYFATLGAARALRLDDCIGNFLPGKEADFVIVDPPSASAAGARMAAAVTVRDRLFALLMLGDDRDLHSTWLLGEPAYRRAG